jgi:hypothetical protein
MENISRLIGVCLTALVVIGLWNLMPTINPDRPHHRVFINNPNTQPTGVPYIPKKPNKEALIIMQNPNCWIGIPGATCGPSKTYVQ